MSKLPAIGTTIFTTMSKMALDYGAINLSQGFPNFPVDPKLVNAIKTSAEGNHHQYAPMAGNLTLLEQLSQLVQEQYGRTVRAESEILVTAGATQAIFSAIQAFVNAGEEVVILDPCYDCYDTPVLLCGAKPIHINLNTDFLPDWNKVTDAITDKTKLLIVNNPHNPSGRILSQPDIKALEEILLKYPQLLLLSDEVYEFITFEEKHLSVHQSPVLSQRAIVVSSFGKTFHITGWKVGYCVAPSELMKSIKQVHQFLVFSVNSLAQQALATYLPQVRVAELGSFYQQKRDYFRSLMKNSRFELLPCDGTYFQTASYKAISDLPDVEFVKFLVKEHGVATIPISVFNADQSDQKIIRFCFAKTDDTLQQASEKLCKI